MHASLSRTAMLCFGYGWPAYRTYKAVSQGREDVLREWCIYWLIIGFFVTLEWLTDMLLFWLPLYYEAKLVLVIFLWHPRTRGALFVYDRFLQPLLHAYEGTIDQSMEEAKTRVADMLYSQISRVYALVESSFSRGAVQDMLNSARAFAEGPASGRPAIPAPSHAHGE